MINARYAGHRPKPVGVQRVFIDDDGPVGRDLDRSATLVLTRARVYVRVGRRGALLTSLRPERGRGPLGPYVDVVAGRRGLTDYVMFEHDGTPPHSIRARRRKTLRFIWHGRVVFYKRVRHPGTKGSRFLSRALRDLR